MKNPYDDPRVQRRIRAQFSDPIYWIGLLVVAGAAGLIVQLVDHPLLPLAAVLVAAVAFGRLVGRRFQRRERESEPPSDAPP